jgi:Ferritin-like domain
MKKSISKNGVTSQSQSLSGGDPSSEQPSRPVVGRRSFLKGLGATGALLVPATALLTTTAKAKNPDASGKLTKGDAAILRFLAVAEIIETDLWLQYWELGGQLNVNPTNEFATPTGGNTPYTDGLLLLDGDMPQYINDNTDDEITHVAFLEAYLKSKGASVAELDLLNGPTFRTLKGSTADGVDPKKVGKRLTNLTELNVDTRYWTRYRSDNKNPDLGDTFAQAVNPPNGIMNRTAIPRDNDDTMGSSPGKPTAHVQAIAFTAGFHFAFIEIGGTSLYPSLAQRVSDPEVLRVVLSIGPTEAMHFQTWQDKAGNANTGNPPLTDVDPRTGSSVTFVDFHATTDPLLQANLIMPEPTSFLNRNFPIVSIIRPTETKGAAMGAVKALMADGLFNRQSEDFFELIADLASDADAARRESDE